MYNHKILRIGHRFEAVVNKDGHVIRRKLCDRHEDAIRWATHQLAALRSQNNVHNNVQQPQQGMTPAEVALFAILAREYA